MANKKISELTAGTTPLAGDELIPVVQGGATVRVPASALQGEAGPQGPAGPTGATGPAGPQGPAGADGTSVALKGSVATVGDLPAGATPGDLYVVTADGDGYVWNGATWDNVGPIRGPEGPAGPTGATGPEGPSAYEVAVAAGFVGTEAAWLASLVGPTGPAGPTGATGPAGPTGETGPAGTTTWAGITDKPTIGTAAPLNVAATGDAAAGEVVKGDDTRLTNSRAPSGGAGGVLSGSYPNPGFAVDMATQAELEAVAATAASKLSDAPSDGKTYGRKNAAWSEILTGEGGSSLIRSARTSNTALSTSDKGALIDIISGTFTQTFDAAASLGSGWFCYLRNSGAGDITVDPNGSEIIDGVTSYAMYSQEMRIVVCDGSAFFSYILTPFAKKFTASATFHTPPGYSAFDVAIWPGAASGQRSGSTSPARGGSGASCFVGRLPASKFGTTETLVVGSGGAAVTTAANGNPGGESSIGSIVVVAGSSQNATSSSLNGLASSIVAPYLGSVSTNSADAPSVNFGGGAGGSVSSGGVIFLPGQSYFAGNGGAAGDDADGTDGVAPGGGGGGTRTGSKSGAGARGEIRLWGVV